MSSPPAISHIKICLYVVARDAAGRYIASSKVTKAALLRAGRSPWPVTAEDTAPMAAAQTDYIVKDISLADWGRKEIAIAETEMPGLMATRV